MGSREIGTLRNREGYFDPTAGIAIRNIERTERHMPDIRRGNIFYIEKYDTTPKRDLPTHVTIRSTPRESTALCEQVTTVSVTKVKEFMCAVSAKEMTQIDTALLISLDLTMGGPGTPCAPRETQKISPPIEKKEVLTVHPYEVAYRQEKSEKERITSEMEKKLIKAEAELQIYKSLYSEMTDRAMGRVTDG